MDDTELVQGLNAGDPAAWRELVRRHVDLVCRAARHVLGPAAAEADVEDVVQTVFLKLFEDDRRRLRTFKGESKFSTWLVVVARRQALDFRQRTRRAEAQTAAAPSLDRLVSELKDDPAEAFETDQAARRLRSALDHLPARDGLLVRLLYLDGASYEQAARFLAAPVNSISPWLARAKARLKVLLTEEPVRLKPSGPSNG